MRKTNALLIYILLVTIISCNKNYSPKPRGYFRIDFPEKEYRLYDSVCPFNFEFPVYTKVIPDKSYGSEPCWINIYYPQFDAKIHISYKSVEHNLGKILEDTYTLAYKHVSKADAIEDIPVIKPENNVFGLLYNIKGNAASSKQFYLTDSVHHYLRGALYFNVAPNKDSLAPVIDFIGKDIDHLINTFTWK